MGIRQTLKLGRDWHVKAGFTDKHPLTELHNRPVGATTSWLRVREHRAAVSLANSLIHLAGNHMAKSPFEGREGLRTRCEEYGAIITNGPKFHVHSQRITGDYWLVAELFYHNGAYVVLARDGAMIAEWSTYADWIGKARRGAIRPEEHHLRLYLKT